MVLVNLNKRLSHDIIKSFLIFDTKTICAYKGDKLLSYDEKEL